MHWREPVPTAWYLQVFLHYVDASGPYADLRGLELTRFVGHQILERIALEEGGPRGSSIEVPRGVPA